jgi:hypothetical protein
MRQPGADFSENQRVDADEERSEAQDEELQVAIVIASPDFPTEPEPAAERMAGPSRGEFEIPWHGQ